MHIERKTRKITNKFGDTYEVIDDLLVYDDEDEKRCAYDYNKNRKKGTLPYSKSYRMQADSIIDVSTNKLFEAINEYFDMLDNLQ